MSVERLVKEFAAQDVGAFMTTFIGGVHTRVAKWVEENKLWIILPEGQAMLDEKDGVVIESATVAVEEKATRKMKAHKNAFANALDDGE